MPARKRPAALRRPRPTDLQTEDGPVDPPVDVVVEQPIDPPAVEPEPAPTPPEPTPQPDPTEVVQPATEVVRILAAVLRSVGGSVVLQGDALDPSETPDAPITIYRTNNQVTVHLDGTPEPEHILAHRRALVREQRAAADHVGRILAQAEEEALAQIKATEDATADARSRVLQGVRPPLRVGTTPPNAPPRRRR